MSSHHIVRNEQEPALLVLHCGLSTKIIHELLEWSPTVIIVENMLETLLSLGVKIDVLLCEPGHIEKFEELLLHQQPVRIIATYAKELPTVFEYLKSTKHHGLNILSDENSQKEIWDTAMKYPEVQVVCYQEHSATYFVKNNFSKWFQKGTMFKVRSEQVFTIHNATYDNKHDIYTVTADGLVTLHCGTAQCLFEEIW